MAHPHPTLNTSCAVDPCKFACLGVSLVYEALRLLNGRILKCVTPIYVDVLALDVSQLEHYVHNHRHCGDVLAGAREDQSLRLSMMCLVIDPPDVHACVGHP